MQIDTAGTYTLKYTAEDECGNVTEVTREVVAEQLSYRTVLYTDGTLIINEKSTDIDANIAKHGMEKKVFDPFNPNGDTPAERYEFGLSSPWRSYTPTSVEVGSSISPKTMSRWFSNCNRIETVDARLLDTSKCVAFHETFSNCQALKKIDGLERWDVSAATDFSSMFSRCFALEELDVSNFVTESGTNFGYMFNAVSSNALALESIDVSNFDTSQATDVQNMFSAFKGTTIYASTKFSVPSGAVSTNMFSSCANLIGGAGTTWSSSNPTDKTYARIDGGTSNPGYFTLKTA